MSQFLSLVQRNISPELFFNSFLSDQDLSKLLCTCRGMKEKILEWKIIFPIENLSLNNRLTDKKLYNLIFYYSNKIKGVIIHDCSKLTTTIDTFATLNGLTNLSLKSINRRVFCVFVKSNKYTLRDLKSISISFRTRPEQFEGAVQLFDFLNYHSTLVELNLEHCYTLYKKEFEYVTKLTNLTSLTVVCSNIDDDRLKTICSSCLLIEILDIRSNNCISYRGLDNISLLVNLRELFFCGEHSLFNGNIGNWMPDLFSNNQFLCKVDFGGCLIEEDVEFNLLDLFHNNHCIKFENFNYNH
jgi:hypothetical protein